MQNANGRLPHKYVLEGIIIAMRKFFCAVMALGMIFSMLTGCSKGWKGFEKEDLSAYITLGEYKGLTYTDEEAVSVTAEETDEYIQSMLAQDQIEVELVGRVAEVGDCARISYTVTADGEPIDSLKMNLVSVTVGETGLESCLIGAKKGDVLTYTQEYDADYKNEYLPDAEKLAGKTAVFTITVNKIFMLVMPELTDEYVNEKYGLSTVEAFREQVANYLITSKQEAKVEERKQELWETAVGNAVTVKLPKELTEKFYKQQNEIYEYYASSYNMSLEDFVVKYYNITIEQYEKNINEYAVSAAKQELVLYAIAKAENLLLNDGEYQSMLAEYAAKDEEYSSPEELEAAYGEDILRESMLMDKVKKFLYDNSTNAKNTVPDEYLTTDATENV